MPNPATISILKQDGSIEQIYCYKQGELAKTGVMLYLFYTELEKINDLIQLKAIVQLEEDVGINPIDFINISDDNGGLSNKTLQLTCEKEIESEIYPTLKDFLNEMVRTGNDYLFKVGTKKWYTVVNEQIKPIDKDIKLNLAQGNIEGRLKDLLLLKNNEKRKAKNYNSLNKKMLDELDI